MTLFAAIGLERVVLMKSNFLFEISVPNCKSLEIIKKGAAYEEKPKICLL